MIRNGFVIGLVLFLNLYKPISTAETGLEEKEQNSTTASPVVILCFHDIGGKGRYSIKEKDIIQIFDYLKKDYMMISLKDWYFKYESNIKKGVDARKPAVILTFDDGFPSLLKIVYPLLIKYNYGATFYIYLNRHASHSNFYKQLASLPKSIEIGSHSFTHDLIKIGSESLFKELYLSKKKLEYLVNRDIVSWAWPYGYYSDELIEQAQNAGYILQVSTDSQVIVPGTRYTKMARYTIQQPNPMKQFKGIMKMYRKKWAEFQRTSEQRPHTP